MSKQLTQRYPVANAVVSRLRSQLFENSAIVAHLLEEGPATEETINEIIGRLQEISSTEATLKTYQEHFATTPPPNIKSSRRPPNEKLPSADVHANVPRPASPEEVMRKLESNTIPAGPKKKPCKDCKKPRKGT